MPDISILTLIITASVIAVVFSYIVFCPDKEDLSEPEPETETELVSHLRIEMVRIVYNFVTPINDSKYCDNPWLDFLKWYTDDNKRYYIFKRPKGTYGIDRKFIDKIEIVAGHREI